MNKFQILLCGVGLVSASELSLSDLLETKVTVASGVKGMSIRESPGILTVVNRDAIKKSGARDLSELLRQIPGFELGSDVQGVVGLGIRGNWAHEGKVLILIDGLETNESSYSTTQFGNHYSLDQVERVEIIRGPGSALYGGYAELGVINLVSRTPDTDFLGATVNAYTTVNDPTNQNTSLTYGTEFGEDGTLLLFARHSLDRRSDEDYVDIYGDSYNMRAQSKLESDFVEAKLSWNGLDVVGIYDEYKVKAQDEFDYVIENPSDLSFSHMGLSAKYTWEIASGWTMFPKLSYHQMSPWTAENNASNDNAAWKVENVTQMAELVLSWDPTDEFNLIIGGKGRQEKSKTDLSSKYIAYEEEEAALFSNGKYEYSIWNVAGYSQAMYQNELGVLTGGFRFEHNPEYGQSFVPRAAYTKVWDEIHFKLLASQAFRAPSIENISAYELAKEEGLEGFKSSIKPEKTTVYESEVGLEISENWVGVLNAFWTHIKNPILYSYIESEVEDEEGFEAYNNFEETGTYGSEAELRFLSEYLESKLSYSFYKSFEKIPSSYQSNTEGVLLAFPQHKVVSNISIDLEPFFIHFNNVWTSSRPSYTKLDEEEEGVIEDLDPHLMSNLVVGVSDLYLEGLEIEFGVYNLLDKPLASAQPFDSWHTPIYGKGREFGAKLSYEYEF